MNDFNLLCQTIRFQRTALQNSLAMISAVQRHGERLLQTTLDQSPWIPGQEKDAVLFWAGMWRKGLTGATEMVDKNLATMERLTTSEGREEMREAPPTEPPGKAPEAQPLARKAAPEKKQTAERPQAEKPQTEMKLPAKEAEPTAMVKTAAEKPQAAGLPEGKPPEKKKKPRSQKVDRQDNRGPRRKPGRQSLINENHPGEERRCWKYREQSR